MSNSTKYLSVAETAKLVRQALKKAFPGVKFSVRSQSYAGGASIDIRWTNGPTVKMVDAVADQFSGADFDGMIDMKIHNDSWLLPDGTAIIASKAGTYGQRGSIPSEYNDKPHQDAIRVHFGADYIFANRDYTLEFVQVAAAEFEAKSGIKAPEIKVTDYDHAYFDDIMFSHGSLEREARCYLADYAEGIGITGDRWYATADETEPEPADLAADFFHQAATEPTTADPIVETEPEPVTVATEPKQAKKRTRKPATKKQPKQAKTLKGKARAAAVKILTGWLARLQA